MAELVTSNVSSPHWTALISYLCIYLSGLIGVTIVGWGLYQAKPKPSRTTPVHQPRYNINGLSSSDNDNNNLSKRLSTNEEKSQQESSQNGNNNNNNNNMNNNANNNNNRESSIAWSKYFILWKEKSWILLSLFIHIIIQGFNFAVMVEFLSLVINEKYSFNPDSISNSDITRICVISVISFILYRFGSAILIWRLSHSVRKSTFQIIDITILYQLLKGYKKKTRNNPGRIVQYINYLNAMLQSCWQATVQLVFLMKTRIIGDNEWENKYSFIYIVLFAFILNIYCVVKAIYEKDQLLTSEAYRKHKTIQQISTHVIFRFVDVSLRIIILAMLWLTIGFGATLAIFILEFLIVAYLAYYTKQTYRLQEMVAVILHISNFSSAEGEKLRPLTPATIREKNILQVQLNVDVEEIEKREEERKREMVGECQCFKWRIACNIIYIILYAAVAEVDECDICPPYDERKYVTVGSTSGIILMIYCGITALMYPFIYWILSASSRWSKSAAQSMGDDADDIFGYLERNDFESAKEILDFGKQIEMEEYIEWAEQRDFSTDNNPNLLLKFLYQQKVKLNKIRNKSQGGLNILHQVCKNPEIENAPVTVKFLIKLGFDLHSKTDKTEDTPFHVACQYCNKSVLLALLKNGNGSEELFLKNKLQQTPLHSLMVGYDKKYHSNQIEIAKLLFNEYNAEQMVLEVDIHGKSPLHIACINKKCPKEIIKILLKNGAYSYQADNDDYYPKDYVGDWPKKRKDTQIVLKWLNEGLNSNNTKRPSVKLDTGDATYAEVNEETRSGMSPSPKTVPPSERKEENEEEEMRRLYGDSDEDDDDKEEEIEKKKQELITPVDPNATGSYANVTPQQLEMVSSQEIDSDEEEEVQINDNGSPLYENNDNNNNTTS